MKRASRRLECSLIGFARRALGVAIVLPLVVSGLDRVLGEAANTPEVKRAQHALEQARNDQALIPKARQAAEEALRGVSTRHSSVCELTGSLHRRHKGEPISVPSQQLLAIAMECAQAAEIHADPKLDLRSTPERVEAFRLAWCGFTRAGDAQRKRVAAEQAIGSLVAWMDTFGADQARIDDALRTHARLVVDVIVGWGGVMDDGRNYPEALKSFNQAEEFIKLRLPDETHARSVCADSKGLVLIHLGQYALALQAFRDSLQLSLAKKPVNKWEVIDRREKICQTLVRIDNRKALKEEATALARDLDELLTDDSTMASTELTARSMVIEACLATDLDSAVANRCCERIDKLGDLIDEQLPDSLPETIGLIASRIAMSHLKISQGDKVEAQRCLSDAQRRLQLIRMGAQRIGTGDDLLADYDYQLGLANMALGQYRTAAAHFDQHRQLAWNRNLDSLVCAPLFSQYLINAIEIAPRMNVAANLAWQAPNDPRIAELTATWLLNSRQQLSAALEAQIKSIPRSPAGASRAKFGDGALAGNNVALPMAAQPLDGPRQLPVPAANVVPAVQAALAGQAALADKAVIVRERGPAVDPKNAGNADPERRRALEWIDRDAERSWAAAQRWQGASLTDSDRWLSVKEFQRKMARGDVAVLYARVEQFHWVKNESVSRGPHYGAWIIKAVEGQEPSPPRFVDLGRAEDIDSLIVKWQSEIRRFYKQLASDEELKRQAKNVLAELSKRVLEPLRLHRANEFAGLKRLRILPDSTLWMAPFSALPFQDKEYLVEAVELEIMRSGHQLFPRHEESVDLSESVMFGDPDFNAIGTEKAGPSPAETLAVPATTKAAQLEFDPLRFGKLDTMLVGAALNRFDPGGASIMTGQKASEADLRSLRNPFSLIVSSHGYCLPRDAKEGNADQLAGQQMERALSGDLSEHPWIRSGFALAGFNQLNQAVNGKARTLPSDNDGNITAYDVLWLDLRGTKLVVLAACSTGLGDTQTGESVASLWQAFHLAGAGDVVATLWDIPDVKLTSTFVADFLEEYGRPSSAATSLRSVQLSTIKRLRDRGESDHPVFWAGFVATTR